MATPLRSLRPRQAFSARTLQASLSAPSRSLHITGAQNQPSSYLAFQTRMAELSRQRSEEKKRRKNNKTPSEEARPFNTHRALKSRGDSSPIDLCYFPAHAVPDSVMHGELPRAPLIPLLPDSSRPGLARLQHGEPVLDAAASDGEAVRVIATSSGVGIAEGRVLALSESDGGAGADAGGVLGLADGGKGELRRFWDGFLDDLVGVRARPAATA